MPTPPWSPTRRPPGYSGPDSFTYRVSDGDLFSTSATATITVSPPPPAQITLRSSAGAANTEHRQPDPAQAGRNGCGRCAPRRGHRPWDADHHPAKRLDSGPNRYARHGLAPGGLRARRGGGRAGQLHVDLLAGRDGSRHASAPTRGVDTANPINWTTRARPAASSATITAPSITTTVANTRLVAFFGITGKTTIGPPSGMLERQDLTSPPSTPEKMTAELADVLRAADRRHG